MAEEVMFAQGAEARLYTCTFLGKPCVAKERFPKKYRHPDLDAKLTQERISMEARCMQRARRGGLDVPTVYFVEIPRGRIYMERVHGVTAKAYLASEFVTPADRASLAAAIGEGIARLHNSGLVHGDLTTSNIMIRGLTHDATGALTGAESLVHATDSSTDASPAAGAAAEEAPIVADAAPAAAAAATSPAGTSGGVAVASSAPIALPLKRKASDFVAGSASAGATGGAAAGASGTPTASDAADTAALPPPAPFPYKVTFIDFGLAENSAVGNYEERGVDLYVLQRAITSGHTQEEADGFFDGILRSYFAHVLDAPQMRRKFDTVRMRGRKRLAFG